MIKFRSFIQAVVQEPPIRLLSKNLLKLLPVNIETKAHWDLVPRPHYLVGLFNGTKQAKSEGYDEICAIEFGVAAGNGLLELQKYAAAIERYLDMKIHIVGFDNGRGLPDLCGDFRDHPDLWKTGDYPMDEEKLRSRLNAHSRLIIGNITDTLHAFIENEQQWPVGFVAFDLDLYSSTKVALQIFTSKSKKMLRRVPVYFDNIYAKNYHKYAGEYLAITECNNEDNGVIIDKWYNIKALRPFPENIWTNKMYIAHDLDTKSRTSFR